MGAVDAVLHKGVSGGRARLCMMDPLVQNRRVVYPGYAAVEYVQVRCRSRLAHLGHRRMLLMLGGTFRVRVVRPSTRR